MSPVTVEVAKNIKSAVELPKKLPEYFPLTNLGFESLFSAVENILY